MPTLLERAALSVIARARPRQPIPHDVARYDPYAMHALLGFDTPPSARLPVTERTLHGIPACSAAVSKIANAVAQMMVGAETVRAGDVVDTAPVVARPSWLYHSFTFWREVASTALARGNWVGLLADFDEDGFAQQVVPVPIDAVHCVVDPDGYVDYEIDGAHHDPADVVHVRVGLTMPGDPWAIGVIEAHRRGLSGMLDQQAMATDVWRAGAVPSGVVQLDTANPTDEQVGIVKRAWISVLNGRRTVAVTGKAMTYTPVNWNADDAQFIESRQFTVAEAALMFGLRPEDLGASIGGAGQNTYGNRTDDALQRIIDSYTPVMLPIEQAWSDLLAEGTVVRGQVEALLRSTTEQRYTVRKLAQELGLETPAESRELEGRPPAPDDAEDDQDPDGDPDDPEEELPDAA